MLFILFFVKYYKWNGEIQYIIIFFFPLFFYRVLYWFSVCFPEWWGSRTIGCGVECIVFLVIFYFLPKFYLIFLYIYFFRKKAGKNSPLFYFVLQRCYLHLQQVYVKLRQVYRFGSEEEGYSFFLFFYQSIIMHITFEKMCGKLQEVEIQKFFYVLKVGW